MSAISVTSDVLVLRFPRGDFTDTYIRDLVASARGSTAGDVRILPWSQERVERWSIDKDRYERVGRHVARVIRWAGRSPEDSGLVQRVADRLRVPLFDPPKHHMVIMNSTVDGRGWSAGGGSGVEYSAEQWAG